MRFISIMSFTYFMYIMTFFLCVFHIHEFCALLYFIYIMSFVFCALHLDNELCVFHLHEDFRILYTTFK